MSNHDVSISIFSYRESPEILLKSIFNCIEAGKNYPGKVYINVLINGNEALFDKVKDKLTEMNAKDMTLINLSIYSYNFGDKANAWNQYFYMLKPEAKFHVFIDGYVYVEKNTFVKLATEYDKSPFVAATGVPSIGRTAQKLKEQMISEGGIHGNLCILTDTAVNEIVNKSFRIPVYLYRVDGLVGAIINFNFSPKENKWNSKNIKVFADLTWSLDEKKLSLEDVFSQFKRMKRQLIGSIENKAIREYLAIKRVDLDQLPRFAPLLLQDYVNKNQLTLLQKITSPMKAIVYKGLIKQGNNFIPPEKSQLEEHKVRKF